jgi:hypothetical protein
MNVLQSLAKSSSRLVGRLWLRFSMLSLAKTTEDEIEAWAEALEVFFILSVGRSGSMFLANLLNQAPESQVCHEPTRADFAAYVEAFYDENAAIDYLQRFRKKEIYLRIREENPRTYGEVNTNMRRHCNALEQEFPNLTLIHLVRDGRDVVRSMMSRRTFQPWDPVTSQIHPLDVEGEWAKTWPQMKRFEKACWYWMIENRFLRRRIGRVTQFERLISDYGYFASHLLAPLGLTISQSEWEVAKRRPKNVTRQYQIPHWSEWDDEKKQAFEKICGAEMRANGYAIVWQQEGS